MSANKMTTSNFTLHQNKVQYPLEELNKIKHPKTQNIQCLIYDKKISKHAKK